MARPGDPEISEAAGTKPPTSAPRFPAARSASRTPRSRRKRSPLILTPAPACSCRRKCVFSARFVAGADATPGLSRLSPLSASFLSAICLAAYAGVTSVNQGATGHGGDTPRFLGLFTGCRARQSLPRPQPAPPRWPTCLCCGDVRSPSSRVGATGRTFGVLRDRPPGLQTTWPCSLPGGALRGPVSAHPAALRPGGPRVLGQRAAVSGGGFRPHAPRHRPCLVPSFWRGTSSR